MSKFANLVVFIDGTGNNDFKKSVEEQTNVARLWHACEEVSTDEVSQNVIYKPGVGTRRWELVRGQARGAYLCDRVNETVSWLDNEVKIAKEDGRIPRIYLFGFSRGAYAVRWLATKIPYEIEVLGVWDTVKATLSGPDVDVASRNVKRAFHAIAIDEHRGLFDVTHFRDSPQAVEVWFPGCHSDVGGGYKEADLSYAPLNWMVHLSTKCGLLVDQAKIPSEPYFDSAMPVVHDETQKFGWRFIGLCTFDRYFNRKVGVMDIVYPTVAQLRELGYSPDYLPQNCVAWNENAAFENMV